ncbi:Uncharacterised protein [Yokenella regensburgei]|nr:Uncharacterised protein [Yokenella regensburgei]
MLAGHQSNVACIVGSGVCHITGGKDILLTCNLQVFIDDETTLRVALGVELLTKAAGSYPCGPDYRGGGDVCAVFQRHAVLG